MRYILSLILGLTIANAQTVPVSQDLIALVISQQNQQIAGITPPPTFQTIVFFLAKPMDVDVVYKVVISRGGRPDYEQFLNVKKTAISPINWRYSMYVYLDVGDAVTAIKASKMNPEVEVPVLLIK